MTKSADLSNDDCGTLYALAYAKAFRWCQQWNPPMFSVSADSIVPLLGGWIVTGTIAIPGSEVSGFSVWVKRRWNDPASFKFAPITIHHEFEFWR